MNGKISKSFFLVLLVIVAIYGVMNSYYTLENTDQAVIERFGEVVKLVDTPGLNFKIPFIERVYVFNTTDTHQLQYGFRPESGPTKESAATYQDVEEESIALTKGSYLVNIGAIIQYRITNAADYRYNVDDPIGTIRLAFESVVRRNLQNKELNDALLNKDTIATEIMPELTKKLNEYEAGITITDVKFTDVLLPEPVQFSYDDVNNARNEKTEYLNKAEKYKNEQLPQARATAYEMIQSAEAYKLEKIAQAEGDVAKFSQVLEKYKTSKAITKKRLYIETMQEILQKTPNKYIIDLGENSGTIKYLPLDPKAIQPKEGGNK